MALKTLALEHVSTSPELWVFVKDVAGQVDGPRLAYIMAIKSQKYFHDYPAGLADLACLFKHRNAWTRCFAILSVQVWAELGHDVSNLMPWLADVAVASADCV